MSFSLSSLVRLLVFMAVSSTILAVGLSKLDPPKPASRVSTTAQFANINEYFLDVIDRTPRWLDSETGQITAYPLEDGDVLEAASCSPWVDDKNQHQAVGRWSRRTRNGTMSMSMDFGIARYTFPGGVMLDQVSTESVPVSPPCWFPGTRARILFVAGDGELYHYAFEPDPWKKGVEPEPKRDPHPKQMIWRCPKPGKGNVFLGDLTWPEDPRMGGCVIVTLREQERTPEGTRSYSQSRVWWLKLNVAGTEIVDAGPFLVDNDGRGADLEKDKRTPTIGTLADGKLTLVYLQQRERQVGWELRIAPIEFDSDHRNPRALEPRSVRLAAKCLPARPSYSSNGLWLNAIAGPEVTDSRMIRISLANLFKSAN